MRTRHSRLVMFVGFAKHKNKDVYVVTEYLGGGDLSQRIWCKNTKKTVPSWSERIRWLNDIAEGLTYVLVERSHSKHKYTHTNIRYLHYVHKSVHRDVKSPNILLTDRSTSSRAKLGDFNLAKIVTGGKKRIPSTDTKKLNLSKKDRQAMWARRLTTEVGTPAWMAPELMHTSSEYGPAVDVYSFGIVMWECLELTVPWREFHETSMIFEVVLSGRRPGISQSSVENAPQKYIELMKQCLDHDPKKRPPIGQVHTALKNDVIERNVIERNNTTSKPPSVMELGDFSESEE